MTVSVVIPVYNGSRYLKKLYKSLSSQSFEKFEVLFINDGSTDNSLEILKTIEKSDSRVKVCSQVNKGICAARNCGIRNASGKYIIFLDQDDGIENDLIENYVKAMENNDVDMAVFGKAHYYIVDGKTKKIVYETFENEIVKDLKKICEYILNVDNKKRLFTIWNCIYKTRILKKYNIHFDEHFRHGDEDGMFNTEYALKCRGIVFSNRSFYHYYLRKGYSTISKYNKNLITDFLYYIQKLCRLTQDIEDEGLREYVKLYILRFYSNVYKRYCRFHNKYSEKKLFVAKIRESPDFKYALSFSGRRCPYNIKIMNRYWDVYCFFCHRNKEFITVAMLDILLCLKKLNGQK